MYASEITLCLRHSTFWLDPTKLVEKYGFRSCIHPLHLYLKYILNSYHLLWASLVAEMVKNLPAMQETWVQSLDWEDPLEKGTAAHSSVLAFKIPWTEKPGRLQGVHGVTKSSDMTERLSLSLYCSPNIQRRLYTAPSQTGKRSNKSGDFQIHFKRPL